MSPPTVSSAAETGMPARPDNDYFQRRFGPILGAPDLWLILGFRTADAFRKAVERGKAPVPTFTLPNRRGRFALTADVVRWLESLSPAAAAPAVADSEATTEPI